MAVRHALRLSPRDPFAGVYFGFAGFAQFIGGNYEAAIQLAREGIRLRGDYAGAHRVLTAAAAMAGYDQMARDALRDLRRSQPSISLAWITRQMPFKRDAERSRYLEALRRAGLR
jgi:tetratricopeptide (TPR) repeat protein